MSKLTGGKQQTRRRSMEDEQTDKNFCKEEDVEKGIAECNFNKAIGQDGFDGKMLSKAGHLKKTINAKIQEWISKGKFPEYIKEGRLILLSKNQGELYPEIGNSRPIVVNSHLSKIIEKVIVIKIHEQKSELLVTGNYQNGFKENKSTHLNLIRLFNHIKESS
ncbi:hypothetical protein OXYTRIMIC_127 [Oxytricha trifallax]|uniref:Uncharacterized protein n=1 Tax=Oxytricha trifallax TaxID=1172189 RepID=A0A073HY81_9SPIT|nr:hypothetical protein OXYTRIMIC_127 [Oxytricha trifallax]